MFSFQPYKSTPFTTIIKLNKENINQLTLRCKDNSGASFPQSCLNEGISVFKDDFYKGELTK